MLYNHFLIQQVRFAPTQWPCCQIPISVRIQLAAFWPGPASWNFLLACCPSLEADRNLPYKLQFLWVWAEASTTVWEEGMGLKDFPHACGQPGAWTMVQTRTTPGIARMPSCSHHMWTGVMCYGCRQAAVCWKILKVSWPEVSDQHKVKKATKMLLSSP